MHPFIKEKPKIEPWMTSRILDFSEEDVNKLLHVCDVLITDYSSVIYEFVLLERPILFYAFDEKKYNAIRGFHWDFERYAPGRICKDFESLMKALKTQDYGEERRIEFQKFGYDFTDTHSTDRLIDRLFLEEKPLH